MTYEKDGILGQMYKNPTTGKMYAKAKDSFMRHWLSNEHVDTNVLNELIQSHPTAVQAMVAEYLGIRCIARVSNDIDIGGGCFYDLLRYVAENGDSDIARFVLKALEDRP